SGIPAPSGGEVRAPPRPARGGHAAGGRRAAPRRRPAPRRLLARALHPEPHAPARPRPRAARLRRLQRRVPPPRPAQPRRRPADDTVPPGLSERYAHRAGDEVTLHLRPGEGHFEHIDPRSGAWRAVVDWL